MRYEPIKVEYINPFVEATQTVFRTMLQLEIQRGKLYLKQGMQPSHEVSGIIGLSGLAKGTVLLGMSLPVALHATGRLLGETPKSVTPEVIDAVGELTNMIAGSAKVSLESLNMSISLPSVIAGKNHTIAFPTGVAPIGIPFETEFGLVSLEVSLVDSK